MGIPLVYNQFGAVICSAKAVEYIQTPSSYQRRLRIMTMTYYELCIMLPGRDDLVMRPS
jgi:hypothetical protein